MSERSQHRCSFKWEGYRYVLGLTAAYSIIKRHGGDITLDSELDKGTKVVIHLPKVAYPVNCTI
ncbi:ATP-binding protein [Vibrio qinghaiensis]|uniref:ATP-binding protein n=1 Tax=Vibrio TaxID=662 RepID=UPI0012FDD1EC